MKGAALDFRLIISQNGTQFPGLERVEIAPGTHLFFDPNSADLTLRLDEDRRVYLWGDAFYVLDNDGNFLRGDLKSHLLAAFETQALDKALQRIEGTFNGLLLDPRSGRIELFSDRFSRIDLFYSQTSWGLVASTTLDFIFEHVSPQYDQLMLAHLLSVYGWYAPKGRTIYANVLRLNVGEIMSFSKGGLSRRMIEWHPEPFRAYGPQELEEYYQLLRTAITTRANQHGVNWVEHSSGWDSSILLGMLIDEFGKDKVRQITGQMRYSAQAEIINKFEMDKIQKICAFYGIESNIVDFDFVSPGAIKYIEGVLPVFRARHVYIFGGAIHMWLSDGVQDIAGKGQTVFNGETSDSFHNFGFSQFATFFHRQKPFTEYADKMNCYLYGPSFLSRVLDDTYQSDRVYEIFRKMYEGVRFDSDFNTLEERLRSYLVPFLYGRPRIPFSAALVNPLLRPEVQSQLRSFPFEQCMPEIIASLSPENIYSWLCHLYHHFHSQGSTVGMIKASLNHNQHQWRMPFHDLRLVSFLSRAPESWGRGLEINNTKYPLKWVCRNKLKFPYEVLEEGPHSYLYDVIEGFSLAAETLYRSGIAPMLKESIMSRPYRDILSPDAFDIDYLDRLVEDYGNGIEKRGIDFTNTVSLLNLCLVGWYR